MTTRKVYTHPEHGEVLVKDGFSWPGFFFNFGWALYKNLWFHGIVLAILVGGSRIASLYYERQIDQNPDAMAPVAAFVVIGAGLILIASCIWVGVFGNRWVEQSLMHRGYRYVGPEEKSDTE